MNRAVDSLAEGNRATSQISPLHSTEDYRSGHNEAVLKTVCLYGHEGSNPPSSAKTGNPPIRVDFLFCKKEYWGIRTQRENSTVCCFWTVTEDFCKAYTIKPCFLLCKNQERNPPSSAKIRKHPIGCFFDKNEEDFYKYVAKQFFAYFWTNPLCKRA